MKISFLLLVLFLVSPFVRSQIFDPTIIENKKSYTYSSIINCDNGEIIIVHRAYHASAYYLVKLDANLDQQWDLEIKLQGSVTLKNEFAVDAKGETVYVLSKFKNKILKYAKGKIVSETGYERPKGVYFEHMYLTTDDNLIVLFDQFNGGFKKYTFDTSMNYTIVESDKNPLNHLWSEETSLYKYENIKSGDDFFLFETSLKKADDKTMFYEISSRKLSISNELSYVKILPEHPINQEDFVWYSHFEVDDINKQVYVVYLTEDKETLRIEAYDFELNQLWARSKTLGIVKLTKKHLTIKTYSDMLSIYVAGSDLNGNQNVNFFDTKTGKNADNEKSSTCKSMEFSDYVFINNFHNELLKPLSEIAKDKNQNIEIVPMKSSNLLVIYDKKTVSLQVLGK